jgi:hypothetical protein
MSKSGADSGHPAVKHVNPLSVMQNGEKVICEISRHPIGLFVMYAVGGGLLLVIAGASFFLVQQLAASLSIITLACLVVGGFLFLASKIYWDNYWVVTSDSLTQMTRTSLFDKEACQLSLANLEDVSAHQEGMWAHLFHYGTISAETAGATDKFTMTFCPNPTPFAQKILAAREKFEQGRHSKNDSQKNNSSDNSDEDSSKVDSYEVPTGD